MTGRIEDLERAFREIYMEYYYHLHKNPELSYQEKETARYVADKLKTLPLDEIKTGVGGYGVVALLRGGKPGPVVALRADMDALSMTETTEADFASAVPGVMHACGHDAHTAMLMGAAHVLCAIKEDLPGSVKFIFQPSEEMTPRGGALGMIEEGALDNPRVDAIIGMHVWPMYATGMIGAQDGAVSAASDHLTITIKGRSAHASMPHQGVDAIVASSAVVQALQSIISRSVDPRDTAVITIGTIKGGSRYNVIPEEVTLEGTVRTFNPQVTAMMPEAIGRAVENTVKAYGASAEVSYESGYPPVMNDPFISQVCREAMAEVAGTDGLLPPQAVPAGGEDFAFFAREIPASFAWLGCRPDGVAPGDMPQLHNEAFLPDPKALSLGVRYFAAAVLKLLSRLGERK